jgi:tRNA 2-thiouridine synthesizing protein A
MWPGPEAVTMTTLDARGLKCPLPVLKARKAMKDIAPGALLTVLSTDAGAPKDFEHFCAVTGHQLVESSASDGVYKFVLKKAAD